jgi:hypothetical protein
VERWIDRSTYSFVLDKHIGCGGPVTHYSFSVALQLKLKLIYKMIAAWRVDW